MLRGLGARVAEALACMSPARLGSGHHLHHLEPLLSAVTELAYYLPPSTKPKTLHLKPYTPQSPNLGLGSLLAGLLHL